MSQFLRGATGLKVKEVPGYVQKYAVQNWTPAQLQSRFSTWLQNYKTQHIDGGSAKPLLDVLSYGFVFSYALSWPRELAHYKHEQAAKLAGGKH